MTRANATLLAVAFVGVCGALAYGGTVLDRRSTRAYEIVHDGPPAIHLCIMHGSPPRAGTPLSPHLLASAILALNDDERAELAYTLDAVNDRWAALANPLFETIDEEDADLPLAKLVRKGSQAIVVAASASRGVACATDGLCTRGAASECPPGFVAASGKDLERARFLAWPYGYAVRVRASSEPDARAIAKALRAGVCARKLAALVVTPFDREEAERAHGRLVSAWARHEALATFVQAKGDGGAREAYFPLSLEPEDVVVMPRLEAVVAPDALEEEVVRCARAARTGPLPRVSRLVP